MDDLMICPMEYYTDRGSNLTAGDHLKSIEIAEDILKNRIVLWNNVYFEPSTKNIFDTVFETSAVTNREYLLAMDYLSSLLSAYKDTNDSRYLDKFLDMVCQFFDYCQENELSLSKSDDLIPCAQSLMFIKSFSIVRYDESLKRKIVRLLYSHAQYCYNDYNHADNHNHGLFTDMGLLHLSVLFGALPEAQRWRNHAVERVKKLFQVCFYEDGFNNEGSLIYFWHNLIQYKHIIEFCDVYKISGLDCIKEKLKYSEQIVFASFIRSDRSIPMIGDGAEKFLQTECNNVSALYPDAGICVAKLGELYLTFKCKATLQSHTHIDDTSITARFRTLDLALDPGQYNYDRYHPINRFLRTSGGHSGIFPIFADGLSLKEYLKRRSATSISKFDFDGTAYYVSGGYELDDGMIKVRRDITIKPNRIEVRDSWNCTAPQNMRQRFVLPKEFLERSRFTVSKKLFETTVEKTTIQYEIMSEKTPIITTMNFGVQAKQYLVYEPTLLLDTVAENSMSGEITASITILEEN